MIYYGPQINGSIFAREKMRTEIGGTEKPKCCKYSAVLTTYVGLISVALS